MRTALWSLALALVLTLVLFLPPPLWSQERETPCWFGDGYRIQRLEFEIRSLREQQQRQAPQSSPDLAAQIARLVDQQAQILALLQQRQAPLPVAPLPAPLVTPAAPTTPQVIILPIAGQPMQQLPIAGQPWQVLPIAGQPMQQLPIAGQPLYVLPIQGQPMQQLPVAPQKPLQQALPIAPAAPIPPQMPPVGYQRFTFAVMKGR